MKPTTKVATKSKSHSTLDSCIQIEDMRISRSISIPKQVHFQLNYELMRQIEQLKAAKGQIHLSPNLLTNLRRYALINAPLQRLGWRSPWSVARQSTLRRSRRVASSPLIFSSNYYGSSTQQAQTLFRSVIDLEGKISQQIHQDLWQDPQLLHQISQTHYWLISDILAQLPLNENQSLRLTYTSLLALVLLFGLAINYFFALNLISNIAVCLIVLIIVIAIKRAIAKQLKYLVIKQIISGWLAKSVRSRQIGLIILSYI